jgi:hypothetical protein
MKDILRDDPELLQDHWNAQEYGRRITGGVKHDQPDISRVKI